MPPMRKGLLQPTKIPPQIPALEVLCERHEIRRGAYKLAECQTQAWYLPDLCILVLRHTAVSTGRYAAKVPTSNRITVVEWTHAEAVRAAVGRSDQWRARVETEALASARPATVSP
jgi:hypothetical protein